MCGAKRNIRRFGRRARKGLSRGGKTIHRFADRHRTAIKRGLYVATAAAPFVAPELLPFAVGASAAMNAEKGRHVVKGVIKRARGRPRKTDTTKKPVKGGKKPSKVTLQPVEKPLM